MASNTAQTTAQDIAASAGEKLSTCDIVQASERASDFKKNFICTNDVLHEQMLNSPWPVIMYAFSVLFVMFLVKRSAEGPHRAAARAEAKAARAKAESEKAASGTDSKDS